MARALAVRDEEIAAGLRGGDLRALRDVYLRAHPRARRAGAEKSVQHATPYLAEAEPERRPRPIAPEGRQRRYGERGTRSGCPASPVPAGAGDAIAKTLPICISFISRACRDKKAIITQLQGGNGLTDTNVVTLDGVAFDVATGEILDAVPGDRIGWLAAQLARVQANIRGWEQAAELLRQNIEKDLIAAGVRSVATKYGTPRLMAGRETADTEAVKAAVVEALGEDFIAMARFYHECVNGFKAAAVKDWLGPRIGIEATDALIRRGKGYMRLDPPREEAPRVRKQEAVR